jgi:hypothetical protein
MKSAVDKVMWIGRASVFTVGLAVTLALMLGVATVALAAVPGDPFKLGQVNIVNNATTTLQGNGLSGVLNSAVLKVKRDGSTSGPGLTVENTSTGGSARGVDINVPPGEMPINVNSGAGKSDLNVDRLDGKSEKDFLPNDTYVNKASKLGPGSNGTVFASVNCDPGDKLLGGGGFTVAPQEDITTLSAPFIQSQGWDYQIRDVGAASSVTASALCADFPPQH